METIFGVYNGTVVMISMLTAMLSTETHKVPKETIEMGFILGIQANIKYYSYCH